MDFEGLAYGADGLLTVVVQDRLTGEVRMVGHANEEALRRTVSTGVAHFWSRSRRGLWRKGETSGNVLHVREIWVDCDRDAVVYLVDPAGPTCHTGKLSCFYEHAAGTALSERALPFLPKLEGILQVRAANATAATSYTKQLLEKGAPAIGGKLREEASEFARAIEGESRERVTAEAADVVYHLLVGLLHRGIALRDVEAELAKRFGVSGHAERAARSSPGTIPSA